MNKSFLILILFVSLFTYAEADYEKSDPKTQKFFDQYEECIYKNLNKEHYLSIHYELQRYLPNYGKQNKKSKLYCNKIIDIFFVNKSNNNKLKKQFDKSVEDGLFKNDSRNKNLYIDIYLTYHLNILWSSENIKDVKNSLIEIEENYLKKSDLNNNFTARSILSSLGWFYNVKVNFANFNKAHEYLLKSTKIQTSKISLSYAYNNLGVIYDQDRYKKNAKKKNDLIALKYYKKAADLGLYHAYGNLTKFYLLGLGGVKPDYDKVIKNHKLARISSYGDNNFSELNILFNKKRLPKNLKEYLIWLENYTIDYQDPHGFQELAWKFDEHENPNSKTDYMEMYKWQYLCSKHCNSYVDRERALSEMYIFKTLNLSKQEVETSVSNAIIWENKFWYKPIQESKNTADKEKKNLLVDFLRKALIKN
ncbi:hypothetical protein N9570_04015 [Candidatus Pelagibacter sp.]|nr:hypothetical protein [Candidatus Pelagibacter sp.]